MNEVIDRIPLDQIVPNPWNRKHGKFDETKLASLAETIKADGVHEPAIVRMIDSDEEKGDTYQLVAGERRWRASKMAGMDVLPCIVRKLTDSQVMKIVIVENLQREDISPLDEADGYERLRADGGYNVELIAQEVGRSPAYVYQRLRLQHLVPEIRALLEGGKISTAVAVLIARPEDKQQELVKKVKLSDWALARGVTAHDIDDFIQSDIMMDLTKVAWKHSDAKLVPKAGSCSECDKRTGAAPALFSEIKGDHCTDGACYKAKQDAIIKKNLDEIKDEDHLVVRAEWSGGPKMESLSPGSWEECKKKTPGALRAIVINGPTPGRLTYAKKVERSPYGSEDATPEEIAAQEAEEAEAEKRLDAKQKANRAMFEAIMAAYRESSGISCLRQFAIEQARSSRLEALASFYGWKAEEGEDDVLESLAENAIDAMDERGLIGFLLACEISGSLSVGRWGEPIHFSLPDYLELYRIDGEEIRAKVYGELGVSLEEPEDEDDFDDEDEDNGGEEESSEGAEDEGE